MARRPEAPGLQAVRAYWEEHPLYGYELPSMEGPALFDAIDRIKRTDVERWSEPYWGFHEWRGRDVLDIGCGPGWLSVRYAAAGARVTSVDLTGRAVDLTRRHLAHHRLEARVLQANAEQLPFPDGAFDLVVASGVLHHTPDTERAVKEARRVLRPSGLARITLYHKGLLHRPGLFRLTRLSMGLAGVRHPGADLSREAATANDFIRRYDGAENPIGRGYTTREARSLFERCGFSWLGHELHFFPARFVPLALARTAPVHRILDRFLGTMLYTHLAAS